MTAAVLLFATFSLAMKTGADAQAPDSRRLQVQVVDDPTCTPLKSCTQPAKFPYHEDICVEYEPNKMQCWNACDMERTDLSTYSGIRGLGWPNYVGSTQYPVNATIQKAIAMMVQAARTMQGLCPGVDWNRKVECNLDQRCTAYTLNRGFCSINSTGVTSNNVCLDMCDTSIPLEQYGGVSADKAAVQHQVELVRAGRDPLGEVICPGSTVWLWLWFPIVLACSIGCCYGGFIGYNQLRRAAKRTSKTNQQDDDFHDMQAYDQQYDLPPTQDMEEQMLPPQDFQQDLGPEDPMYMPVQGEEPPPMATRDIDVPEKDLMDVVAPPVVPPAPAAPQTMYQPRAGSFQPSQSAFAPPGMAAPSTFYNSQRGGSFQPTTQYPGMGQPMTQYPGMQPGMQPGHPQVPSFRPM